ncbi:MAG TPA: tRNA lysidine(34) synthetase TilS [Verrucomicrobiae bacterium]
MNDLIQRLQTAVQQRQLLPSGARILVAVSGGLDSMVLLHVLQALASKNRWYLAVAHYNHHLRGRASAADERLVRKTAARLKLDFFAGGADVKAVAARSRISLEMAARKLRHEFLARTARAQKIPIIALAHHADDQVELFFLRLLRGASGEGLGGMKWRSPSPADKGVALVRPLLGFSKAELTAFAQENKIQFREDATNRSEDFLRNRVRGELLPLLRKKYQPAVDKTVLRLMDIAGAEAEFAGQMARAWQDQHSGGKRAGTSVGEIPALMCAEFFSLPVALQRRLVHQQLIAAGLAPDFELVEQLRNSPGKAVSVTGALAVTLDSAGKVQLRESTGTVTGDFKAEEMKVLFESGAACFGGRNFRWRLGNQKKHSTFNIQRPTSKRSPVPGAGPERRVPTRHGSTDYQRAERELGAPEYFDADKVGGKIVLRHWRPGDRFQPIGMKSPVKLQDLFVNARIPAARRRELVVAVGAGGIFWVEGLRIGERCKITPQTRRQLVWNWSKNAG